MIKSTSSLTLLLSLLIMAFLSSCGVNSAKSKKERDEILKEIMSYQDRLPFNVPGTTLSITDIAVNDDIVSYTCTIGEEDWGDMSSVSEVASTDRNMARVISNVSNEAVDKFIEHGLGLKYIYKSLETGTILMEIEMSANKMKDIRDKVNKGELQAYTMIELAKMELAKLEIPSQIEEGVWLTDAYIEGNEIYYIATIESEIDSSDLSNADLSEMKEGLIEDLKKEGLIMMRKKEIVKENIHFVYVYKDSRGQEFAKINIGPYDF